MEQSCLGHRDSVQDVLGVTASIPTESRQRLKLMLTGQVSTGGATPLNKLFAHRSGHETPPPAEEYHSDDCLLFFNAVPAYVAETGVVDFYNKVLPYADQGQATVFGHLRRALSVYRDWMERHSATIYGCTQSEFRAPQDCRLTQNGEKLYMHIFVWPFKHLHLPDLGCKVEYARFLHDGSKWETRQLTLQTDEQLLFLPVRKPDVIMPVIELTLK